MDWTVIRAKVSCGIDLLTHPSLDLCLGELSQNIGLKGIILCVLPFVNE